MSTHARHLVRSTASNVAARAVMMLAWFELRRAALGTLQLARARR
jgi:hypothetical protein